MDADAQISLNLADLPLRQAARITGFATSDVDLETRLREIGFAEGDSVTPLHAGLFGKNPISVRLNGTLIALRKADASVILVEAVNV